MRGAVPVCRDAFVRAFVGSHDPSFGLWLGATLAGRSARSSVLHICAVLTMDGVAYARCRRSFAPLPHLPSTVILSSTSLFSAQAAKLIYLSVLTSSPLCPISRALPPFRPPSSPSSARCCSCLGIGRRTFSRSLARLFSVLVLSCSLYPNPIVPVRCNQTKGLFAALSHTDDGPSCMLLQFSCRLQTQGNAL
ncbi:hypothetical protein OH77DRAFT_1510483 [Trametes cingulata]|nr:hypothetical protein OH77DRAFT_1510483 [Trametes cingulata]